MAKASPERRRRQMGDMAHDLVERMKYERGMKTAQKLNRVYLDLFRTKAIPEKSELKKEYRKILNGGQDEQSKERRRNIINTSGLKRAINERDRASGDGN